MAKFFDMARGMRAAFLCFGLLALPGCAAVALTAGGIAAGTGVNHTLGGIAYKTFNNPLDEMRGATLATLAEMEMEVTDDGATDDGWEIKATAIDREIDIELERLTASATRMRVVASEGELFFKDSATATEIILMTADNLAA